MIVFLPSFNELQCEMQPRAHQALKAADIPFKYVFVGGYEAAFKRPF